MKPGPDVFKLVDPDVFWKADETGRNLVRLGILNRIDEVIWEAVRDLVYDEVHEKVTQQIRRP